MAKTTLPAGITAADIAAFMEAKAATEKAAAKEAAKAKPKAKAKAKQERDPNVSYAEAKAAANIRIKAEFPIEFHQCEIIGGKKGDSDPHYKIGTKVDVTWIGANRFLAASCRAQTSDGTLIFIDPRHLKSVKPLPKERVAKIEAEREEASSATIYVPGTVLAQTDKSIRLNYRGWFSALWFPKEMVEKTDAFDGDLHIYAVPLWKVRLSAGNDSVAALEARQDELTALVNAANS